LSERRNKKGNALSEERPKGLEVMKKEGSDERGKKMKGDEKTDKDRKTNECD
jgi:hypothetical protein